MDNGVDGKTGTHCVIAELCHDGFHSVFILFEEEAELFVLMQQCLILDNEMGVHTLQFGFKRLCGGGRIRSCCGPGAEDKPFEISVLNRLSTKPEPVCAACSCRAAASAKPG